MKGVRHTVATNPRETGLDERSIADQLGKKTPSMARHHSRSANLAERNRKAVAVLDRAHEPGPAGLQTVGNGARFGRAGVKPAGTVVQPN